MYFLAKWIDKSLICTQRTTRIFSSELHYVILHNILFASFAVSVCDSKLYVHETVLSGIETKKKKKNYNYLFINLNQLLSHKVWKCQVSNPKDRSEVLCIPLGFSHTMPAHDFKTQLSWLRLGPDWVVSRSDPHFRSDLAKFARLIGPWVRLGSTKPSRIELGRLDLTQLKEQSANSTWLESRGTESPPELNSRPCANLMEINKWSIPCQLHQSLAANQLEFQTPWIEK